MKKLMLITAISSVVIFGCSKEDLINEDPSPITNNQPVDYMPLAIGNYWIYDTYNIDTLGNETFTNSSDSAYVDRDTLINGETHYIIEGDYYAKMATGSIIRNGNNSVLYADGSIFFTTNNLGAVYRRDTINIGGSDYVALTTWVNTQSSNITIPAGTFSCYDKETEMISSQASYPWGIRSQHSYYNTNIGVLASQFYFYGSPSINESRLVRYNIN